MVQNKIPWKRAEITDNHYKFYLDNRHTQNGFELIDKLSPGARDLIKLILEPNPELRIKMEMILVDEWFSKQAQSCKACCEKGLKERDFYDGALDLSLDSMSVKSKSRSSSMTPKRKVNIVQGSLTPAECHHNRHHPIVSEEYF